MKLEANNKKEDCISIYHLFSCICPLALGAKHCNQASLHQARCRWCQSHMAYTEVLDYYIQPAGASWTLSASLVGIEVQDGVCWMFLRQAKGRGHTIALSTLRPGDMLMLGLFFLGQVCDVLAPRDPFNPPEGAGVKAMEFGSLCGSKRPNS